MQHTGARSKTGSGRLRPLPRLLPRHALNTHRLYAAPPLPRPLECAEALARPAGQSPWPPWPALLRGRLRCCRGARRGLAQRRRPAATKPTFEWREAARSLVSEPALVASAAAARGSTHQRHRAGAALSMNLWHGARGAHIGPSRVAHHTLFPQHPAAAVWTADRGLRAKIEPSPTADSLPWAAVVAVSGRCGRSSHVVAPLSVYTGEAAKNLPQLFTGFGNCRCSARISKGDVE